MPPTLHTRVQIKVVSNFAGLLYLPLQNDSVKSMTKEENKAANNIGWSVV